MGNNHSLNKLDTMQQKKCIKKLLQTFSLKHILYITDSILLIQIILVIVNGYILCCHVSTQHSGSGLIS